MALTHTIVRLGSTTAPDVRGGEFTGVYHELTYDPSHSIRVPLEACPVCLARRLAEALEDAERRARRTGSSLAQCDICCECQRADGTIRHDQGEEWNCPFAILAEEPVRALLAQAREGT